MELAVLEIADKSETECAGGPGGSGSLGHLKGAEGLGREYLGDSQRASAKLCLPGPGNSLSSLWQV